MCAVSMIGDHFGQQIPQQYPWTQPGSGGAGGTSGTIIYQQTGPSQADFDALKRDILQMKELLKKAKIYDEQTGQKDCEMEDKIKALRDIAVLVGISLDDIFTRKVSPQQSRTEEEK